MKYQLASQKLTRRDFIKTTAASTAVLGFPAITRAKSPNSKLQVGLIGVGGRGRGHVNACRYEDIVALCDVNKNSLKGALRTAPEARTYKDMRDFFGKLEDIDAVVVSTTEHTHAFATLPALQAKKHVYCENKIYHTLDDNHLKKYILIYQHDHLVQDGHEVLDVHLSHKCFSKFLIIEEKRPLIPSTVGKIFVRKAAKTEIDHLDIMTLL